jgi:hypothetical protein
MGAKTGVESPPIPPVLQVPNFRWKGCYGETHDRCITYVCGANRRTPIQPRPPVLRHRCRCDADFHGRGISEFLSTRKGSLGGNDHPNCLVDRCSRTRHVGLGNSILGSKHSDTDWPPATSSGDWSAWRCSGRGHCDSGNNSGALICALQPASLRDAGRAETFLGHDVRADAVVRNARRHRIDLSPPARDPSSDDAIGHNRNPIRLTWPVSVHPKPFSASALVCLGTGVAFRGLAFCSSMGNEQNSESVVFDGLRRNGDGLLPVCRHRQHRALGPGGQYFRSMKTPVPDCHASF